MAVTKPKINKEKLVNLFARLRQRSNLKMWQIHARVESHYAITRAAFENRFVRLDRKVADIPPALTVAVIATFTQQLTKKERCTAIEAIELANLTRYPINQLNKLKQFFSQAEFEAALKKTLPVAPVISPPSLKQLQKGTLHVGITEETTKTPTSNISYQDETTSEVKIYLQGDFATLSPDRRTAAIASFAAIMGISPHQITIYRIYEGSIIFELGVPKQAIARLQMALQTANPLFSVLQVEKVIIHPDLEIGEEWILKKGKFKQKIYKRSTHKHRPIVKINPLIVLISRLRKALFNSLTEAATYFSLDPNQITKYETNQATPQAGYLAELARLYAEKQQLTQENREPLLQEINKAISYLQQPSDYFFENWATLSDVAAEFLNTQQPDSSTYKQQKHQHQYTFQAMPNNIVNKAYLVQQHNLPPLADEPLIGLTDSLDKTLAHLLNPQEPQIVVLAGPLGCAKSLLANAVARHLLASEHIEQVHWFNFPHYIGHLWDNFQAVHPSILSVEDLSENVKKYVKPHLTLANIEFNCELALLNMPPLFEPPPSLIVIDGLKTETELKILLSALKNLSNPAKFLLTIDLPLANQDINAQTTVKENTIVFSNLNQDKALTFIRQQADNYNLPRIQRAAPKTLQKLIKLVNGNPLALQLIIAQTHQYPLNKLLKALDFLKDSQPSSYYTALYNWIWDTLDQTAQRILIAMLLTTDWGATLPYLAFISELSLPVVSQTLNNLVKLRLVNQFKIPNEHHYTIDYLTQNFLQEKLGKMVVQTASLTATLNYSVLFKQMIINSTQFVLASMQSDEVTLPSHYQEQALHTLRYSFKLTSAWQHTRQLLLSLAPRMEQAGYRSEWIPYLQQGIKQSKQFDDLFTEAELYFQLGVLYQMQGSYQLARTQFKSSVDCFAKLNNQSNQARALNRLAYIARLQHHFEEAKTLINEARKLLNKDDTEWAYSNLVLGTIALDQRNYSTAIDFFKQSLTLWQKLANKRYIGWSLINLGVALEAIKSHQEAKTTCEQAIVIFKQIQDPIHQALAEMNLGNTYLSLKQPEQAITLYLKAKRIFQQTQELPRLALVTHNMGYVYRLLQQWNNAEIAYCLSLSYKELVSPVASVVNTLDGLGLLYLETGQKEKAIQIFAKALNRLQTIKGKSNYTHWFDIVNQHLKQAKR